jgi:adenylate cyclase
LRKLTAGILVGLASAAVVLGLDRLLTELDHGRGLNPLATIELKTYDWRLRRTARPAQARKDLILVEIDEYSLRNLQSAAGRWPWPRAVHSMLLDYLSRAPARLIAYDVNFAEPDTRRGFDFGDATWSGAESDEALIESMRRAGNVILLADATYEASEGAGTALPDTGIRLNVPGILERRVVFPPFNALADASSGLGHNLFVLDADGPIRHSIPFVRSGGRVLPSLGVVAALRAAEIDPAAIRLEGTSLRLGDRVMPLTARPVRTAAGTSEYLWGLIDFRGPALLDDLKHRTYPSYSFYDLEYSEEQILAGQTPTIDPAIFRDKIVFVGVTAAGLYDVFETPFSGGKMPGIQIHAAVADDILSNRFMRPAGSGVGIVTVLACVIVVGAIAAFLPAWYATGLTLVIGAALVWAATALFARGLWINLTLPAFAIALSLFGGVSYQYFVEGREKRQVKRLFGRYVSKDIYDQLVDNPALARLGGQRREMTVLFSDIRGFTTISESGEPEEIVAFLNVYFTRMVEIVFRHHGTVDKFVGDMVMALFGAPLDDPDHADHAVQTGLEMIAELRRLNSEWHAQGKLSMDIGIGINTGPMIAGNIGSEAIMSYTVIGDAVNLGSRLESLNKQYGTHIIISEATRARLRLAYTVRPLGEVVVKGKTQAVPIYEVVAMSEAQV